MTNDWEDIIHFSIQFAAWERLQFLFVWILKRQSHWGSRLSLDYLQKRNCDILGSQWLLNDLKQVLCFAEHLLWCYLKSHNSFFWRYSQASLGPQCDCCFSLLLQKSIWLYSLKIVVEQIYTLTCWVNFGGKTCWFNRNCKFVVYWWSLLIVIEYYSKKW